MELKGAVVYSYDLIAQETSSLSSLKRKERNYKENIISGATEGCLYGEEA
jgi:hypothetical protein